MDQLPTRRRMPAWALSAVLHTTCLVVIAVIPWSLPRGGTGEPARAGGIVVARTQADGNREYFDGESDTAQTEAVAAATSQNQAASSLPAVEELALNLPGALPAGDVAVGGSDTASLLPDAGELTSGSAPPRGGIGGEAETYVFGLKGTGSKFVYVFDRSGSMDGYGGRPLRAAKNQLIASLADLDRIHQFQIVFYNERPSICPAPGGRQQLLWGDSPSKSLAERFVGGVLANGGTRHMEALSIALGMQPDVIFFLTDADEPQLTTEELAKIRRLNRGTAIQTIEFGFGPFPGGDNFLMRLARQNDGQHVYVDVSQLGDRP